MTRIRRASDLSGRRRTPTCTKRSTRRRQQPDRGPAWSTKLLRLSAVLVVGSLAFGIWNLPVRTVTVHGLCLVSSEQVTELVEPMVNARWLTVPTSRVEDALNSLDWVESASVHRRRLGRISIDVREHQPLFRCADTDGVVVTCCGSRVAAPPTIAVDRLPFVEGESLGADTLSEVLSCLRSPRWPFQRRLAGVRLGGRHGVEWVLEDGTEIWMGETDLARRLEWLLADTERWRQAGVRHIDLRYDRQVVVAMANPSSGGSGR